MPSTNIAQKNYVTVTGNIGSPKTMIFAHGFGTDQTVWKLVAEPFLKEYRVILFDHVGCGQSDPAAFSPNKYEDPDAYAADLIAICDALIVKNAVLVGHSIGGMIGILAAIRKPEYFSKLVLIGASPKYLNEPGYVGGFERDTLDQLFEEMRNNYYAWASGFAALAMGNPEQPHLARQFAESLKNLRPDIALTVLRVFMESDIRSELAKLDVLTLIIQSREDVAVPTGVGRYLNQHIRNSRLAEIQAAGHLPHMSAASEVIAEIQKFLLQGETL